MIIEALKHILKEIAPMRSVRKMNEQSGEDLAQAELILVAQNMVEELQKMAEDVAQMQTDDLMPLEEKMKTTFGQEQGQAFGQNADQVFSNLLDAVKAAKDELSNAVGVLKGEAPAMPGMGGADLGQTGGALDALAGDEFGAADAASGEEELPTGRELK
jgi:cell division protein ZapA (FtsZ GTPase activity inhibitor)